MAFCNACGANLEAGAKFCPKCGAALNIPAAVPVMPSATAPSSVTPAGMAPIGTAPAPQGSSAVKIILIIVLIIAGLGMLTIGGLVFVGWRIAHNSRIRHGDNGNVRIDSPFGTVETTNDPKEAARNVGVDVYPGATVVNGGGANVSFGNMHTSAAEFESSDPVDAVTKFYQSRYPNANMTTAENGRSTIVSGDKNNLLTISIEERDGKTHIHIARVTGRISGS